MPSKRATAAALAALAITVASAAAVRRPDPTTSLRSGLRPAAGELGAGPLLPTPVSRRRLRAERRAVAHILGYTRYVIRGLPRRREVALTFDDGPGPYSPAVVRVLRRAHAPATFFVVGSMAQRYPRALAQEARVGFTIGDHTVNHPFLAPLPAHAQGREIRGAAKALVRRGIAYPDLFRPPYGSYDASTFALLGRQRMLMVLWSVDSADYTRPGRRAIAANVLSATRPGAIVLMHDGGGPREQTVAALPQIIRVLRRRHYRLVTVPRLLHDDPPPHRQPRRPRLGGG
jgi:peptidoglycan-N-acetylglucosamine deacetylase